MENVTSFVKGLKIIDETIEKVKNSDLFTKEEFDSFKIDKGLAWRNPRQDDFHYNPDKNIICLRISPFRNDHSKADIEHMVWHEFGHARDVFDKRLIPISGFEAMFEGQKYKRWERYIHDSIESYQLYLIQPHELSANAVVHKYSGINPDELNDVFKYCWKNTKDFIDLDDEERKAYIKTFADYEEPKIKIEDDDDIDALIEKLINEL